MALFDVIKADLSERTDWILCKYPENHITAGSTLIVQEGQRAVFVENGTVADIFDPGKYTLSTENLPVLNKLVNIPFGGKSPFSAEIYFINMAARLTFSWGTPGPIRLTGENGEELLVRAFGQIGVRVTDELTVFLDAMGGIRDLDGREDILSVEELRGFFKGVLLSNVQRGIAEVFGEGGRSALENPDGIEEISARIQERVYPEMERYGFSLVDFHVQNLNVEAEDRERAVGYCRSCGKALHSDFVYCPYCGKKI